MLNTMQNMNSALHHSQCRVTANIQLGSSSLRFVYPFGEITLRERVTSVNVPGQYF